jgi:hypothetical protein
MLTDPSTPPALDAEGVVQPVSRADEVSRLIAEAKQTEARQPQTVGAV